MLVPRTNVSDLMTIYTRRTLTPGSYEALGSETPLTLFGSIASPDTYDAILVDIDLIKSYQRKIFELEQQVLRYRGAIERLTQRPESVEELFAEESTPLTAASLQVIKSILGACVHESAVMRVDEEE